MSVVDSREVVRALYNSLGVMGRLLLLPSMACCCSQKESSFEVRRGGRGGRGEEWGRGLGGMREVDAGNMGRERRDEGGMKAEAVVIRVKTNKSWTIVRPGVFYLADWGKKKRSDVSSEVYLRD